MKAGRMLLLMVVMIALILWTGCASTPSSEESASAQKNEEKSQKDPAVRMKSLERKLQLAESRLENANLELQAQETSAKNSTENLTKELKIAEVKFTQFMDLDAPNRIAQAELNLQRTRDYAEEAEEELKQIEIMYKDQDLEDMTAEFVIKRGKRNAERRKQAIAIEERKLQSLREHEIPREWNSLELDVEKKKKALKQAELDNQIKRQQKEIAIRKIEAEIADLKDEMANLKKSGPST